MKRVTSAAKLLAVAAIAAWPAIASAGAATQPGQPDSAKMREQIDRLQKESRQLQRELDELKKALPQPPWAQRPPTVPEVPRIRPRWPILPRIVPVPPLTPMPFAAPYVPSTRPTPQLPYRWQMPSAPLAPGASDFPRDAVPHEFNGITYWVVPLKS